MAGDKTTLVLTCWVVKAIQLLVHVFGRGGHIVAARFPDLADLLEQLREARPTVFAFRREIGAGEERLQIGREETIQRPAALTGHGLRGGHVNFVDVGAFLAVHLDADEMFIQKFGHGFVLKRFAFHDVAPMAGRVTDAEKNGFVFRARLFEGFIAPGKPIDRVMLMLEEVRGFLAREPVGVSVRFLGWCFFHGR